MKKNKLLCLTPVAICLFLSILTPFLVMGQSVDLPSQEGSNKGILSAIPGAFGTLWDEALSLGQIGLNWLKNLWDSYILSWISNMWGRVSPSINKEIETRKPGVEEEFQKEKKEIKEDIPTVVQTGKSLWERFKDLIK
jgi:hypothetical protein